MNHWKWGKSKYLLCGDIDTVGLEVGYHKDRPNCVGCGQVYRIYVFRTGSKMDLDWK